MRDKLIRLLSKCLNITEQGLYHASFQYAAHVNAYSIYIEFSNTDYNDMNRDHLYFRSVCSESNFNEIMEELEQFSN